MPKQTFFNLENSKKEAIIQAALEEFSAYYFHEASVNRIVKKSGISKGSLYQYFKDKKDLYLYLIEVASQVKLTYLKQQSAACSDDFFGNMTTQMIHGVRFSMSNPLYSNLLYRVFQGPLFDESITKIKEMNHQYLMQLLKDAKEKGLIRKDCDLDLMAFFLNVLSTEFARFAFKKAKMKFFNEIHRLENLDKLEKIDIPAQIKELMKLIQNGIAYNTK